MKHLDISSIKGESYSSKTFWLLIIKESTDNCWSSSWHESKAEKRVLDLINELIKRTSTTLVRLMAVSGKIVSIDSIKSNSHLCFNSSSVAAAPEATHSAHPIVAQRRLNRVDYLIAQHRTIQSIRRKRDRYRYTEPSITNMIESWFASPTNHIDTFQTKRSRTLLRTMANTKVCGWLLLWVAMVDLNCL